MVVPYRGTEISITYKPESVTVETQSQIEQRVADGEIAARDSDAAFLVETITAWDLTDDDATPMPLTFEVMKARSMSLQLALVRAIYDDQRNPQQGHSKS